MFLNDTIGSDILTVSYYKLNLSKEFKSYHDLIFLLFFQHLITKRKHGSTKIIRERYAYTNGNLIDEISLYSIARCYYDASDKIPTKSKAWSTIKYSLKVKHGI